MKIFLIFLLCSFLSCPVLAQKFDFDADDLTGYENLIVDQSGKPVTGVVRTDLYSYQVFLDFHDGKPSDTAQVYGFNGNFVGALPLSASVSDNALAKKLSDAFRTENALFFYTRQYIYDCAKAYLYRGASGSVMCSKLIQKPVQEIIGGAEKYSVYEKQRNGQKVLAVEAPFIPVKFRLAFGKKNETVGMSSEIQKSGSAVFFFDPNKITD